jgi:ABC-type nitrate/sulfonate/bicarbonate transport system substrate-binding protein
VKTRILLAALLGLGLVVLTGCDSSRPKTLASESTDSLTLGVMISDQSSLIWLAKDRGYFAAQGLDIKIKSYESGVAAVKDLLAGKIDLATAAETVFIHNMVERPDLRIIASMDQVEDEIKLVARKDRGMTRISDIRNKRIGLLRKSSAEYFLFLLTVMHDVPFHDLQLVDITPLEQAKALAKGKIDAMIVWEPWATKAKEALGTNAVSWPAQSGHGYYWLLLGTTETIKKQSSAIGRVLAALASAEEFIKNRRGEAEQIMAAHMGSSHTSWEAHSFRLELTRSLIVEMENQIEWMDPQRLSNMPNLLNYIHFEALKSVNPEKVKIRY